MIGFIGFAAIWTGVQAFIAQLETICTVVGALAIAIPLVDQGVRKILAKHPNSRFWKFVDRVFFGCGIALVNIGLALDKMLAKRREIASGVTTSCNTPPPPPVV